MACCYALVKHIITTASSGVKCLLLSWTMPNTSIPIHITTQWGTAQLSAARPWHTLHTIHPSWRLSHSIKTHNGMLCAQSLRHSHSCFLPPLSPTHGCQSQQVYLEHICVTVIFTNLLFPPHSHNRTNIHHEIHHFFSPGIDDPNC